MIVFMALAMLVGNGGNALAALRLGEGKRVDAEVSLGNTVFLSLVLLLLIVGFAAPEPRRLLDGLLARFPARPPTCVLMRGRSCRSSASVSCSSASASA